MLRICNLQICDWSQAKNLDVAYNINMPRTWTEEEKEEQRLRMIRLHEEGRAGPQFGKLGGRPKKPRAGEILAEKIRDDADDIYDRLISIVKNGRDGDARAAARDLIDIEERERRISIDEEKHIDELNRTDLLRVVRAQFAELLRRGDIAPDGDGPGIVVERAVAELSSGEQNDS